MRVYPRTHTQEGLHSWTVCVSCASSHSSSPARHRLPHLKLLSPIPRRARARLCESHAVGGSKRNAVLPPLRRDVLHHTATQATGMCMCACHGVRPEQRMRRVVYAVWVDGWRDRLTVL
ncbi:MAG: hypothetical protein EOO65_03145 [Methanosarcinales archaeon]|nr:MAG: hypothetical protein EOO65_03145 [Methanosarcinales archaeon]